MPRTHTIYVHLSSSDGNDTEVYLLRSATLQFTNQRKPNLQVVRFTTRSSYKVRRALQTGLNWGENVKRSAGAIAAWIDDLSIAAPSVGIKIYHDNAYVVMEMPPHSLICHPQILLAIPYTSLCKIH
jgi:hypothetical protein